MNYYTKILILICSTLICSCERRANGSKIYKEFDPDPVVSYIGEKKDFSFELTSENEQELNDNYYVFRWRFHTRSEVEDLMKYTRDVCDQFEKNIQSMGAVTRNRDARSGSFISQSFNYSIDKRNGGISILATKYRDGTELKIELREAEQD